MPLLVLREEFWHVLFDGVLWFPCCAVVAHPFHFVVCSCPLDSGFLPSCVPNNLLHDAFRCRVDGKRARAGIVCWCRLILLLDDHSSSGGGGKTSHHDRWMKGWCFLDDAHLLDEREMWVKGDRSRDATEKKELMRGGQ